MNAEAKTPIAEKVVAFGALGFTLSLAALNLSLVPIEEAISEGVLSLSALLTVTVGIAILVRSSSRRIGWLLVATGPFLHLAATSGNYTDYAFVRNPELDHPLRWIAAWFQGWAWYPAISLIVEVFPQLFPTGAALSRRWKLLLVATIGWIVLGSAGIAFVFPTVPEPEALRLPNPFVVDLFEPQATRQAVDVLTAVIGGSLILGAPASFASLAVRFRRSRGDERQQIKWVVFALGLWAAFISLTFASNLAQTSLGAIGDLVIRVADWAGYVVILFLPLAIGISILKYRLYGIDLLIKGSLVYGSLSAVLATIYFGGVLLIQQLFSGESQISIVLSTLAIAALFSPLRRRIQVLIDKHFYRQRYDARQALAKFSEELRADIELEQISGAILSVVRDTVLPEHASLWIRTSGEVQRETPDQGAGRRLGQSVYDHP